MPGWSTGRPIYHRLPEESEAYQHNPLVDAITAPYDELLMQWKSVIENFERDFLDPDTCRSEALDWLAQLCGFTGEYWDTNWTDAQKRELIKRSHTFIWANKGSQILLEYLLDVFEIDAKLFMLGQFLAGINRAGDPVGGELMRYWIRMSLEYLRTSKEWELVERLNRLYMPCFADSRVVYDRFYAGFSVAGDPVFDGDPGDDDPGDGGGDDGDGDPDIELLRNSLTWSLAGADYPFLYFPNAALGSYGIQFATQTPTKIEFSEVWHLGYPATAETSFQTQPNEPIVLGAEIRVSRRVLDPDDYQPLTGSMFASDTSAVNCEAYVYIGRIDGTAAVMWEARHGGLYYRRYEPGDEYSDYDYAADPNNWWYFPPEFDVLLSTLGTRSLFSGDSEVQLFPGDPDPDLNTPPIPALTPIGGVIKGFGAWSGKNDLIIPGGESVRVIVGVGNYFSTDGGFDEAFWRFKYNIELTLKRA